MTRRIFMALFLMLLTIEAFPYGKLSPWLRFALHDKAVGSAHNRAALRGGDRDLRATVFVRVNNEADADAAFASNDCRVYDRQGNICIVSVPLANIERLAMLPCISRIEANVSSNLTMDTTATVVKANHVYDGRDLPQAYTGKGVVLGIMDVGFDLSHPNFFDSSATAYRIGAFWDQLDRDTVGSEFPVGRDYVGYETVLAKKHSTDGLIQTHATHTLGIAAGSGYDSPYRGMAFESDICAVNNAVSSDVVLIDSADLYKYTTAVDALGFKYIFDYAERQGKPCVASFSEGYTVGMDSEDSLFCDYLNALTGPGRIIIASAGNESVKYSYMAKPAGNQEAGTFVNSGGKTSYLLAQSDAPFKLRFKVYNSDYQEFVYDSRDAALDSMAVYLTADTLSVISFRYPSSFAEGDTIYYIMVTTPFDQNGRMPLAVIAEGENANVAVRTFSSSYFVNGQADGRWADAEISHNVHAPACFPGIIAVGSTIHRTGFTNYLGEYRDYRQQGRNDGVWSVYSSVGPTMDGRIKPDVSAPGNNIISSYSSYYIEANPNAGDVRSDVEHFDFGGRTYAWNANTGTSMATPVVAGAVALWLQANPNLTPEDVMNVISKTSRRPEDGLDYPNCKYGYGEIDVYRGLLEVLDISGIEGIDGKMAGNLKAELTHNGTLKLQFDGMPSPSAMVTLYNLSGKKIWQSNIGALSKHEDSSAFEVSVPILPEGVYLLSVSGSNADGSILIRKTK